MKRKKEKHKKHKEKKSKIKKDPNRKKWWYPHHAPPKSSKFTIEKLEDEHNHRGFTCSYVSLIDKGVKCNNVTFFCYRYDKKIILMCAKCSRKYLVRVEDKDMLLVYKEEPIEKIKKKEKLVKEDRKKAIKKLTNTIVEGSKKHRRIRKDKGRKRKK
jgi:hypothetical protein